MTEMERGCRYDFTIMQNEQISHNSLRKVFSNIWSELKKTGCSLHIRVSYNWQVWQKAHLWYQMHQAQLPQWILGLLTFTSWVYFLSLECWKRTLLFLVFSDKQEYINVHAVWQVELNVRGFPLGRKENPKNPCHK